jgi:hypothetical protein
LYLFFRFFNSGGGKLIIIYPTAINLTIK